MFPPSRMSHASIDAKTRAERRMPEDLIRLCVGIEEYPPPLENFCSPAVLTLI